MASPAISPSTCTLNVTLFSGARTTLPADAKAVLTVRDGNQRSVALEHNGYVDGPTTCIPGLQYTGGFGDNYAIVASARHYRQAGFYPVKINPAAPAVVDIMLLRKNAAYNFNGASWNELNQNFPAYADLLRAGAADDASAADRYGQLMEQKPEVLACYFNLVTAMAEIQLPVGTPLDYVKELIWDATMAKDRFFAWADPKLIDQVIQATADGEFSPEVGTAVFHSGATRSWKQIQFGEANVQLTFHENSTKEGNGSMWVMVEPDIDYYKDLGAHALLEVAVNTLTHSLTDPRQVYVLRWMAGRHAHVPNFEPPYTLD